MLNRQIKYSKSGGSVVGSSNDQGKEKALQEDSEDFTMLLICKASQYLYILVIISLPHL
jgi:hypothetical protein